MTHPDTAEVERVAKALTKAQQAALLKTSGAALLPGQSDRGTLTGTLTDYSFRPARLTPLGLAVRTHLEGAKP